MTNRFLTLALIVVIAGCTALAVRNADERYGPQAVRDRVASTNSPIDYQHAVEPIFTTPLDLSMSQPSFSPWSE